MITVPKLSVTAIEEIPQRLGFGDGRAAVAVMHLLGDITGSFIFVMPEEKARMLSGLLLGGTSAHSGPFDAMARSALTETANIIGGAYAGALGTMTRRIVMLSVPAFGVEPPDAVLSKHRGANDDHIGLCIETNLTFDGAGCEFGAHIVLLATAEALEEIVRALSAS
jgi:chemotaxis protein CheY-P-specific phosphatase CheC